MARWAAWFLPLTLNATVINIDFNGDRYDPGPNARPITYVGQSPAGGGPVWNGLAVDSRLSDGTDDDNITVTGTNLLDSLGGVTAVSFTASPVGGDSTALRMGQSTDDPTQASALFSDYLFNNSSANHAGESPFAITGLGNARTVDLYFYLTSGGITIAGQSPTSFAGSGIFNGGNTYYFQNVPVNAGSVAGTFGSGTAVIGGMTVAGDFVVVPEPINILLQPTHQTVLEGTSVVFQVQVANAGAVSYQWQRNGTDIPRAIAASYNIPWVSGANQGDRFRCLITNEVSSVASAEAVLTVIPDTTPPVIREVQNVGNSQLQIIFSEPLDGSSATNPSQYQLGNGAVVSAAALDNDQQTVILTTSPLAFGTNYTLTVNDVRDRAWIPNSIAADTKYSFTLSDYLTHTVGGADLQGAIIPDTAGFNLSVRGGEIGGTADQFLFGCQQRSGDFDLEVRVASIGLSDPWAKAGLMVRDSLDANSRFAVILATPSVAGCLFMSRVTTGAAAVPAGSFPVNYPYTWLRLQRVGTQFNGYGSWDGSHWTRLGSVTITMPSSVYFGMVSVSHSSTQSTTAQLEDLQNAVDGTVGSSVLPREPLDACSRRTGLVISEIMYHPAKRADGKDLEYIELFNSQSFFQDLSGYRLSGDIDYIFPPGTQLAAGAFLVVAKNPADMRAAYSLSNVMGPYSSRLPHRSGVVRLCNAIGAVLLEVRYDSHHPWPASADGAGHSIVLARPSYGEGNPAAWAASDRIGGSPGVLDGIGPEPLRDIMINEFLANAPQAGTDFIELYNHNNQAINLSGSYLSDDPTDLKFKIPADTIIPARGFVSFSQPQLGFGLNAGGESIYLVNPDRTRVIDAVQFDGQASGVSMGRYPDGAPAFHELSSVTPNAHNSPLLIRDVVINEIMYHPISENSDDEYIELYNQGTNAVDLGLWKLTGGIQFTFAAGTVIPARGYKILARNATRLFAQYPNLNPGNTVGDFKGALSNRGEHLTLSMPDRSANPSATNDTTADYPYIVVDEVSFGTGGRWGRWSDGGGSSLELIDARADHRLACNWADSDESSKSTNWTTIECTGTLDLGNSSYAADSLHILLLGEGECLIDNVEVRAGTAGPNLVANSTFESGVSGWYFQGNHSLSSLETGAGYNSSRSLHIRSTGEGDSGGNRIRTRLTTSLGVGSTATLRARVRWLRGFPEIVLRLHGNWLEASGAMPLPSNLGTPGAPNSRAVANAGPAIYDVTHSPVLPAAKEPVVVTARVDDPDGLDYVQLHYRLDPNTGYTTVNMTDDGTGGDAVAGDEVYSATVPGQAANALIAFYIQAADKASSPVTSQFPSDAPTRECLVRFGDPQPAGSLGTYRLWITQASLNQWKNREGLSNLPIDATFVPGNQRVIYNAGAVYTGSPYKTRGFDSPIGSWCDYIFHFPRDDQFLGATDLKICYPGNLNDDDTTQREQTAYWIAEQIGIYHNHRRYVNLYVIGVKRGIVMEDTQIPNADVIDECYPNEADGDLFKAALWFEFSDSNPGDFVPTPATLQNFMSGGVKKLARYRWNWPKHAVKASANNYDNLFALVDALNGSTSTYVDQVQSLVDVDQWMRNFAVEHIVGNWDSYGYRNGANMFAYKTPSGRWQMLIWDIDVSLRSDYGTGPTSDLFEVGDPTIDRMYKTPAFRRIYFQALSDAANGPLLNANVDPLLDAKYNALRENGISVVSPASIKSWIRSRRAYILGQLLNVAANFTVNGSALIVTNRDTIALTGSAPIEVKTITVNDIIAPVTWNTVTGWSLPLHLEEGTNVFTLIGYNQANQWVPGASNVVTVVYTNTENPTLNAVVINEWLAANTATLPDPAHGTYSPWFELYNPTTAAVDISGWYLTSFLSQPRQWQIPTGTTIPSRGFLLVWADAQTGLNGIDSDLHANFTLDRIGGAIGLAAPNGQWVDTVVFGNQTNDVSQGRYPDGTANPARFMTIPTPGSTNTLALANPPLSFYRLVCDQTGSVSLVWRAVPGKSYRVEYKDTLDAGAWTVLGSGVTAASSWTYMVDPSGANRQRFYRIVLVK